MRMRESEIAGLNSTLKKKKIKIMASGPMTSWQIEAEKVETDRDKIYFLRLQNHCRQ